MTDAYDTQMPDQTAPGAEGGSSSSARGRLRLAAPAGVAITLVVGLLVTAGGARWAREHVVLETGRLRDASGAVVQTDSVAWLVGLAGIALTLLAGYVVAFQIRTRRGLEAAAAAEHDRAALLQSRFHAAVYRAPVGVAVFDLAGRVEVVNDPIYELLGLVRGASSPQVLDYILPEDVPTIVTYIERLASGQTERVDGDFQLLRPDGGRRWCRVSCTSILGPSGVPVAVVGHVQDIEAERAAIEALRSRSRWFSSIVERSSDLILLFDVDGIVTWASPSIVEIIGVTPEDVVGQPVHQLVHRDDRPAVERALEVTLATGSSRVEFRVAGLDEERWLETTASNLLDDPDVAAVITLSRDVTERHHNTRLLAHQAAHDPLTGLLNRGAITTQLGAALARPDYDPLTVAYLDLDGFKAVNDVHGHMIGDDLLRVVARALEGEVRGHDLLARLGGDEFVVVLRDTPLVDALDVAERIRLRLAAPIRLAQLPEPLRISASIGVAVALPEDSVTSLLHAADIALYEAKRRGRNRVEVSTKALAEVGPEVDELLDDLAREGGEGEPPAGLSRGGS